LGKVHLIESEDEQPRVRLEAGKRYEVIATAVVDNDLKSVDRKDLEARPPRLCGSRDTCLAIVEIDPLSDPPRV
jgi:hypothetical protein